MKSSAVILAACAASLAGATPTFRSGNWNSTVVNWNSTTPTNWNSSSTTAASTGSSSWNSTAVTNSTTAAELPPAEAATVPTTPSSSPYWSNGTSAVGGSNETWVNRNETQFSPNETHVPVVPLIRRFRPQRKVLSRAFLPTF
ncbi:hypothetical protein BBK36DRAFT_165557 [Trichoderma citrinoviride]|uniref:Uncharacterized protein n=1 Tax=Trichoderma citrinoviride TaxID=58853 RepID=A0A2T4B7L2_9HYPO|nr:hypothetical protein BBK36DRAFT_165557 [Trichoderma citrinoviride]PTB65219.1 hypothetical protein BBK36DRAFT_165557 [Trichoderma citrinoviride]